MTFWIICSLLLQTATLTVVIRNNTKLRILNMTVAEAIQLLADNNVKLDDISAKLTEGFNEIIELLGTLQNTTLTPEQEEIVNSLKTKVEGIQPQAQQIADIVQNPEARAKKRH